MDKEKKRASDHRSYQKHREKRLAKMREYAARPEVKARERKRLHELYLANKEEFIKRAAAWREANKDYANELARDRYDSEARRLEYEENRKQILAAQRAWRLANPELDKQKQRRNYERHRAARIAAVRKREQSLSPEERAAINFGRNKHRRAKIKGAEGNFAWADYRQILIDQSYHCYWCHADISDGNDHADHMVPLARGGSNWPSNIVASCATCNQEKSTKLPEEFVWTKSRVINLPILQI